MLQPFSQPRRKPGVRKAKRADVFGQGARGRLRVGVYARVSTHDQQTLPLQMRAMRAYVAHRGWTLTLRVEDVGSGASERPKRDRLLEAGRRREIDAIVVWRLDRWGRSLPDLVVTLHELGELGVGFVSLTEAFDLTTSTGRAMAGLLGVFAEFEREILRERVKAGLAQARKRGQRLGRPLSAALLEPKVRQLAAQKVSKAEIARRLSIGRTSVRRILPRQGEAASSVLTQVGFTRLLTEPGHRLVGSPEARLNVLSCLGYHRAGALNQGDEPGWLTN